MTKSVKKTIIILSVVVGIVLLGLAAGMIQSYIVSVDSKNVNLALSYLKEDVPTYIFQTGKKMKGTLTSKQKSKANIEYFDGKGSVQYQDSYFYNIVIFNEVDFSNNEDAKYCAPFMNLEVGKMNFAFLNCENVKSFMDNQNLSYDQSFDSIYKLYVTMSIRKTKTYRVRGYYQNLSGKKYALNDAIKALYDSVKISAN